MWPMSASAAGREWDRKAARRAHEADGDRHRRSCRDNFCMWWGPSTLRKQHTGFLMRRGDGHAVVAAHCPVVQVGAGRAAPFVRYFFLRRRHLSNAFCGPFRIVLPLGWKVSTRGRHLDGAIAQTIKQRSASSDEEAVARCRRHDVSASASTRLSGKPADRARSIVQSGSMS